MLPSNMVALTSHKNTIQARRENVWFTVVNRTRTTSKFFISFLETILKFIVSINSHRYIVKEHFLIFLACARLRSRPGPLRGGGGGGGGGKGGNLPRASS
jgi:hypothetical protein